jgi:hypothetical protein
MGNTVGRQNYISNFQKEVLIGCLLGDGRLECRSKEGNVRLRIHHGEKQKEYLFWKYNVFRNIVSCGPKRIVWRDKKRNIRCISWYFHTLTLKGLRDFYMLFYRQGRKALPRNISQLISPLSLAVWTMDDGDIDRYSIRYNIQCFSHKEQETLKQLLEDKYQLGATLNKDRNSYRLRIKKESTLELIRLIYPFIIPSMRYKIVPVTTGRRFK